jgi:AbrB family looped-hinge helix DNA binding protein
MRARVSEKGQVTIPKRLREQLGIRPGQELEFSEERGRLIATKTSVEDPVDALYGVLKLDRSPDEIIEELRGRPDTV